VFHPRVVVVAGVVLLGVLAVRGWACGNRADAQIAFAQGDLNISCRTSKVAGFSVAFCWAARSPTADRQTKLQNVDFEGRTKMFVSLFQIRRQHIFDPFHECADSARQIAPMCYDEGHGERPATKIGYDLHKRSTL
jgi:hypothetical protein